MHPLGGHSPAQMHAGPLGAPKNSLHQSPEYERLVKFFQSTAPKDRLRGDLVLALSDAVAFLSRLPSCMVCKHPKIATLTIALHSNIVSVVTDSLRLEFVGRLSRCLSRCRNCLIAWYSEMDSFFSTFTPVLTDLEARSMRTQFDSWTCERIVQCLEDLALTDQHESNCLLELCLAPYYLEMEARVSSLLLEAITVRPAIASETSEIAIGMFLLLFHENSAIRKWALLRVSRLGNRSLCGKHDRAMQWTADRLLQILVEKDELMHGSLYLRSGDSQAELITRSFCYLLWYASDTQTGVFYFESYWKRFSTWFAWFLQQASAIDLTDGKRAKVVLSGFWVCAGINTPLIAELHLSQFLSLIRSSFSILVELPATTTVLDYETAANSMELLPIAVLIKLFTEAKRYNLVDTCAEVSKLCVEAVKLLSPDSFLYRQLSVVLWGFVARLAPLHSNSSLLSNEWLMLCVIEGLTERPIATVENTAASSLLSTIDEKDPTGEFFIEISKRLLKHPSENFPATVTKILWCFFATQYQSLLLGQPSAFFTGFDFYFSSLLVSSTFPSLQLEQFLADERFVHSLVLLFCCHFESIRKDAIRALVRKFGFVFQGYFYENCSQLIFRSLHRLFSQLSIMGNLVEDVSEFSKRLLIFCKSFFVAFEGGKESGTNSVERFRALFSCFVVYIRTNRHALGDVGELLLRSLVVASGRVNVFSTLFAAATDLFSTELLESSIVDLTILLSRRRDAQVASLHEQFFSFLSHLFRFWIGAQYRLGRQARLCLRTLLTAPTVLAPSEVDQLDQLARKYENSVPTQDALIFTIQAHQNQPIACPDTAKDCKSPTAIGSVNLLRRELASAATPRPKQPLPVLNEKPPKKIPPTLVIEDALILPQEAKGFDQRVSEVKDLASIFSAGTKSDSVVEVQPSTQPCKSIKFIEKIPGYEDPNFRKLEHTTQQLNTKKRLACDLSSLYRTVLSWSFDALEKERVTHLRTKEIPNVFPSTDEYEKVFYPLLLLETQAQLMRSREEMDWGEFRDCRIISIATVNEFTDVSFDSCSNCVKYLHEHDYVTFKEKGRQHLTFVGVVSETAIRNGRCEFKVRCYFVRAARSIVPELKEASNWEVRLVCSLITTTREYQALKGLAHFPVRDFILNPGLKQEDFELLQSRASLYQRTLSLNESQAQAVAASVHSANPFTLIQGPPGTGKTKTILSIIGLILSQISNRVSDVLATGQRMRGGRQILLCAPSNAAVDEVVRRVKAGVLLGEDGSVLRPKIVRFGSENIHEDVRDLSLDSLVADGTSSESRDKIESAKSQLRLLEQDRSSEGGALQNLIRNKRNELKALTKAFEDAKQSLRSRILSESQLICCTLSGSGHELLAKLDLLFDTVIIDEACQSVETSSLIPLKYRCRTCILVGDPNQLPPTILSQVASSNDYEKSLFQRIQAVAPKCVQMLSVQYRMHPEISAFPAQYFYANQLGNGPGVGSHPDFANALSFHEAFSFVSGSYAFVNVSGREESTTLRSFKNEFEVGVAVAIVQLLCSVYRDVNLFGRIGIITPYKQQQRDLRGRFFEVFGAGAARSLDINTVDAFQGQEKDVIIFSCVRAGSQVGFLADTRRLNVALTRAKSKLFVLGNAAGLGKNTLWNTLIEDAKQRSKFFSWPTSPKIVALVPSLTQKDLDSSFNEADFKKRTTVVSTAVAVEKAAKFIIKRPGGK